MVASSACLDVVGVWGGEGGRREGGEDESELHDFDGVEMSEDMVGICEDEM